MPVKDSLIAASAQAHDLTVVTRNLRDFEMCGVPVLNPFS
jgi:predicted nucleic acid-binding protein